MKTMKTLEECAEELIKNGICFKQGERATIIYDHSKVGLAGLIGAQIEILGGFTSVHCIEKYKSIPDDGKIPLKLPDSIKDSLKNADVSFYINGEPRKNEYESFTRPMLDLVGENKKLRHVHMLGISENAF